MPPSKHALLSASSSHRWIECPPSARLCERVKEASTSFAREGSEAHELCEYKLRTAVLGEKANDPTSSLEFYNDEMERCSNDYAAYISEIISGEKAEGNIPIILIEQQLDFSKYVPDGFGTGDCVIVSGSTLYVIDYKHGLGVLVSAEKNSQMLCYALGAYEALKDIYEIKSIVMTIFQPRRENLSTYELSVALLFKPNETIDDEISVLIDKRNIIEHEIQNLVEESSKATDIDKYRSRYDNLVKEYENASLKVAKVIEEKDRRKAKYQNILRYANHLKELTEPIKQFDDELWFSLLDKATVKEKSIIYQFKDGREIEIEL